MDDLGIGNDIRAAFDQWAWADQNQNSTNNTFFYCPNNIDVLVWQVNFPGVPFQGDPFRPAASTVGVYQDENGNPTSDVAQQIIYLYPVSICGNANGAFQCWDLNAPNLHTFVHEVVAHEIGNGMGLDDQIGDLCLGQTPGESVMNGACGTNDENGPTLPAPAQGLPNCDNMSIF